MKKKARTASKTNARITLPTSSQVGGRIKELDEIMHEAKSLDTFSLVQPFVSDLQLKLNLHKPGLGDSFEMLQQRLGDIVVSAKAGNSLSFTALLFIANQATVGVNSATVANKLFAEEMMKANHAWPFLLQSADERNCELQSKLENYGFAVGTKKGLANRVLDTKDVIAILLHHFILRVRLRSLSCSNPEAKSKIVSLPPFCTTARVQKAWTDIAGYLIRLHDFDFPMWTMHMNDSEEKCEWLRQFKKRFLLQADVLQTKRMIVTESIKSSLRKKLHLRPSKRTPSATAASPKREIGKSL